MSSEHKSYLLTQSERIVDLQEALLEARAENQERVVDDHLSELEKIGDDLVGLLPNLKEDDWTFAQFMLGSICSTMELWTHAEQAYSMALEHWPEHIGLLNEMAHCQCELGNYENAISFYQQSLSLGGEDPDIHYNIAMALALSGELQKATLHTITSLARFPNHTALLEVLAILDGSKEDVNISGEGAASIHA
jgi:tetratricopeptide (TPR) repeat protein